MQLTRWIRKYERTILVVLTVVLATSFGTGLGVPDALRQFLGRLFGRTGQTNAEGLARVLGRSVSAAEFGPFYVRWARFPLGIEREEEAWIRYAGVALARELGIRVADDEMREFVRSAPIFFDKPTSPEGHYSYTRFREVVEGSRMTQEEFEETLREYLSVVKLQNCLLESAVVSSAEVWPLYRLQRMSYGVSAVRFPVDTFLAQVAEPSAEEVNTLYETENERRYREPERMRVEVLAAPYSAFAADVKVTEEDARQYYDTHPQEFAVPPEPAAGEATVVQAAPQPKPFAEVRESILQQLRTDRARVEAERALREAQSKLRADARATMGSIAEASNGKLQATTTEFFSFTEVGQVPVLGASFAPGDPFIASLFNLKAGGQDSWSDVGWGTEAAVLCRVLGEQPSRVLSLDEAREKVIADLKYRHAVERASQEASALADELKEKKLTLNSELVRERGLAVETPAAFAAGAGDAPAYAAQLFGAERGAILTAWGGDAVYVVEVRDAHAPTWEDFQRAPQQEKAALERTYRGWTTPRWDALVRGETGLEVFPRESAGEAAEEGPAGEGAQEAPAAPGGKPAESSQPAAAPPEEKPGESAQPVAPSPQGSTNPATP